jgi:hypothetical protein
MAGRGNRRAAPRLVFGATVRMDFRGANGAKTCANRENDRLVILSRCGRDDVWLKIFTISNQRTQPSMRNVLPLSPIALDEYEKLPADEKEHFFLCPKMRSACGHRELRDAIFHETDHKPKPHIPRIIGKPNSEACFSSLGPRQDRF